MCMEGGVIKFVCDGVVRCAWKAERMGLRINKQKVK